MRRIAYLMSHYPAVSHAFVLREVEALREQGVEVQTLSIHRADPNHLLADADRRAAATTFSVLPVGALSLLTAHVAAFLRSPRRYLSALALAVRTGAPGVRERLWHLFYFGEAMVLLRHCRRTRITHIHAQFADSATDVAMLVAHYQRALRSGEAGMTWSLAVHGSVEFYNVIRHGLAPKLAHAEFSVAISDFGRSQLMTLSSADRWPHIHVVHCGVNPEVYVPPARRSASDQRAEVLCVGRLLPGKGLSLLFESVAQLRHEGLDVVVTLVGDGPARSELEAAAASLGLARDVRFVGAVGQDQIRGFYERADVFCLPSFAEGIPVVVIEAMAMELPVLCTRIMGIPELVEHGEEGLLVAPGRVDVLTDALRTLVRSPEERRRLGTAARRKVAREFDVRVSARHLRELFGCSDLDPGGHHHPRRDVHEPAVP
jgi:colanic acid/amylovoran biosynthesis glycosyltransferase